MDFSIYKINIDFLEKKIKTNFKKGLTTKQAKQNFLKYGINKIKNKNQTSLFKLFLKQFNDFFVYILFTSSIFTLSIGLINNDRKEIFESILIFIIIFSNAILGFWYEIKKEKSLKIIKKKTRLYAKVLRDNKLKLIPRETIVPGDIIFIEQGDIVPADLRIIESNNLKINESILTGENLIVEKNHKDLDKQKKIDLLQIPNAAFMDTNVISGYAKTVVIKIGSKTQIGKIAKLICETKKTKTPLEKNINELTRIISLIIFFLIIINFSLNLLKHKLHYGKIDFVLIKKMLSSSIILAVAVIPEGLLSIITIILTLGIKKIAEKKTIIKNLKALETLGSVNIICTDKTGTLTKNKMKIKKIYLYNKIMEIEKYPSSTLKNIPELVKLINYGVLSNNEYIKNEKKNKKIIDPVDKSFIEFIKSYNIDLDIIKKNNIKLKEFPFDNENKITITIYKQTNTFLLVMKGACEILLKLSNYIEDEKNIFFKNSSNHKTIENNFNILSQEGYKVLSIAYAKLKKLNFNFQQNISINEILKFIDKNIVFLGAVAIEDPIKKGIKTTIKNFQKAFITPIMITGDHLNTAKTIGLKTGILQSSKDLTITGSELEELKEIELMKKIKKIKIYARVNPENKLKIIQSYKKLGYVVAMIGDGINDAPSIKASDVGIAMGMTGTEITKKTADIILVDDNFVTLKKAILEGRNIFNNIKKSIIFLLSCNIGEIFVILLNTFIGQLFFSFNFDILNSLQILWINLVTDSLVAIALGFEPKESNLMKKKPRQIKNSLLNKILIWKIISEGILIGSLTFLASFIGYKKYNNSVQHAQTFAFMVLCFAQLVHAFNLRNIEKSIFKLKKNNKYLRVFFIISVFLQIFIFFIPFLKKYFQLSTLFLTDIIIIIILSIIPLLIVEVFKFYFKKNIK
ncbi:MAG: cation transport ATPase, P-type [Candidatus Phytoplasma cynodontis]|uniref:cation-translocating P-type ATPase n=1 Tax='Cynodon dactylon' phytoplasma TaxID=295320 RepID=UPI001265B672|nr:cation-transporting P-type ATPase ['Cynodon dactylon' phytoplasma]KAB8121955.1 cation-transporting P-type ATPase ['Cynodon dactylon' phytoplasma]WIA07635.1 MAG: cation transport ATPase, P-type [Candidatus Phytoplasma cynodontis]